MTETIGGKIDKLIEQNKEILAQLKERPQIQKIESKEPYRYQSVIDYLKGQGRITDTEVTSPSTSSQECIKSPEEAISILSDLINKKQAKRKCLTKEELIAYFERQHRQKPESIELVPPFR